MIYSKTNSKNRSKNNESDVEAGNLLAQFTNKMFASSPRNKTLNTVSDDESMCTSHAKKRYLLGGIRKNERQKSSVLTVQAQVHTSENNDINTRPMPIPKPRKLNASKDESALDSISLA